MAIAGAALGASAFGLVVVLRSSLYGSAVNTSKAEALDIATFISTRGRIPRRLPVSIEEMAAQVVGPDGVVLTASPNLAGSAPMAPLRPPPGATSSRLGVVVDLRFARHPHVPVAEDSRFAVAATGLSLNGVTATGGRATVLVADSLGAADHAVEELSIALGAALSAVLVLVGVLVSATTRWALRPVEAIRAEVAALSVSDLHRRVLEPPSSDEIGRLAQTMNAMLGRLAASTERQRQLVADVAHELRNPLASLRTQLEVAAAHPGPDVGALLEGSIAEVDRLARLVDDLLTLARLDEGLLPLRTDDVDLDEVALAQAERLRARRRVEVSVRDVQAARVQGDEAHLGRLVANLADNAERHARNLVAFAVRLEPDAAVMEVRDDGPGIPEELRERVFERFVRLDAARSHADGGAGLGLAIAREIARAHGGDITIKDASPGAVFVVRLPFSPPALGASRRTQRVWPSPLAPSSPPSPPPSSLRETSASSVASGSPPARSA
jgi:signal transduction histidine kinase